jgi:hypothetical protein
MTDQNDDHQTEKSHKESERRSGKDRRKVHTMIDPDKDRRTWDRRKKSKEEKP